MELQEKLIWFALFMLPVLLYARMRRVLDNEHYQDLESAASVGKPLHCEGCGEDLTKVSSVRVSGGPWLCMKCFNMAEVKKGH